MHSSLFRASPQQEVDAEISFHLEMHVKDLIAAGVPPDEARRRAQAAFGNVPKIVDDCTTEAQARDREWSIKRSAAELRDDVKFAWRQLLRAPSFSMAAVGMLALGLGVTTAIFSVVDAVVLTPFPFAEPERVMVLQHNSRGVDGGVAPGSYAEWLRSARSFRSLAARAGGAVTVTGKDGAERVGASQVSPNYFSTLGVHMQVGRAFTEDEGTYGGPAVVVLGNAFWERRYHGDQSVVGQTVVLDGKAYTIVGIAPASFDKIPDTDDMFVPLALPPSRMSSLDTFFLIVYGQLAGGATVEGARKEMAQIAARHAELFPKELKGSSTTIRPYTEVFVGPFRTRLLLLLGAVACVLLIACVNVANLLLARGNARRREFAVRASLGAGGRRIVRQLLTETLVLSAVAGVVGIALAWTALKLVIGLSPDQIPRLADATINLRAVGFAIGVATLCAVAAGLVPALRSTGVVLHEDLKSGARMVGGGQWMRRVLITAEIALSLLLLVGAGLLVRTAVNLANVPPGFEPGGVATARVSLSPDKYPGPEEIKRGVAGLVEQLRQVPGVTHAGFTTQVPLGNGGNGNGLLLEGKPIAQENFVISRLRVVSPDYLAAMGIPLKRGRAIAATDNAISPRVMVVNEVLAPLLHESIMGKRVACCEPGPHTLKEVVGIVGNTRAVGLGEPPPNEFYVPLDQAPPDVWTWLDRTGAIAVRTSGDPEALIPAIRKAIADYDPGIPMFDIASMDQRLLESTALPRFNMRVLGVLAALGLVLSLIGIYSVLSYFVTQRQSEIGVRMALGASAGQIRGTVIRTSAGPVAVGLALGVATSWWTMRAFESQLVGVKAFDPLTLSVVTGALLAAALLAALIPAHRAAKVDPVHAISSG